MKKDISHLDSVFGTDESSRQQSPGLHNSRMIVLKIPPMSDREFSNFSKLIHGCCGIHLPPSKKVMLTGRLFKRLRHLGMSSFSQYYEYLQSHRGKRDEYSQLIDAVTTNKTDFFREPRHFEFLVQKVLPELVHMIASKGRNTLTIWSAGCSSGEEPYTLAMVLLEFFSSYPGFDFTITASDISTRMLEAAVNAIYSEDDIQPVPKHFKYKYLMKGSGTRAGYYRIVPEVRRHVNFCRLNFLDPDFGVIPPADIIFCRNVIIYFDRKSQHELIGKFHNQLMPEGYLFLGHSESLHGTGIPFQLIEPTIYRKM